MASQVNLLGEFVGNQIWYNQLHSMVFHTNEHAKVFLKNQERPLLHALNRETSLASVDEAATMVVGWCIVQTRSPCLYTTWKEEDLRSVDSITQSAIDMSVHHDCPDCEDESSPILNVRFLSLTDFKQFRMQSAITKWSQAMGPILAGWFAYVR